MTKITKQLHYIVDENVDDEIQNTEEKHPSGYVPAKGSLIKENQFMLIRSKAWIMGNTINGLKLLDNRKHISQY